MKYLTLKDHRIDTSAHKVMLWAAEIKQSDGHQEKRTVWGSHGVQQNGREITFPEGNYGISSLLNTSINLLLMFGTQKWLSRSRIFLIFSPIPSFGSTRLKQLRNGCVDLKYIQTFVLNLSLDV